MKEKARTKMAIELGKCASVLQGGQKYLGNVTRDDIDHLVVMQQLDSVIRMLIALRGIVEIDHHAGPQNGTGNAG